MQVVDELVPILYHQENHSLRAALSNSTATMLNQQCGLKHDNTSR